MKFDEPFYFSVICLTIGGLLPKDFEKRSLYLFFVQNWVYKPVFFISNCLAPLLHMIYFRGNTNYDSTDDFSECLAGFSFIILDVLFAAKWKHWLILLEDISKDREFGKHPDYHKLAKRLNVISVFYTFFNIVAVLFYSITAFLKTLNCKFDNKEKDLHVICNEFTPIWMIFEEVEISVSVTVFIFQTILNLFMASCTMTCFLVYELTEIIISHVDNLKMHFLGIFDEPDRSTRVEKFCFCVRYHNHVLELGNRLNNLCKYTSGVVTLFCALCLSNLGNQTFNGNFLGSLLYLVAYVWAVFLLCHSGQNLKDQTYSIKDAVYASKWYNADAAFVKDITFVIVRSQRPVCLETLPIGILEYPLFVLIVKTTYSYFTLLSQKQE